MSPNDADGMANSVDPDQTAHQTAPIGAVWSGSALFAQAYLSENLGSLRYSEKKCSTILTEQSLKMSPHTVKSWKIWMPEKIAVILKFE